MISVIVPVYKAGSYLEDCVNSIRKQSYQDLEIILVDDGSPDICGKLCDDLAMVDSRIIVVHKENGGLSSARNAGLAVANGEYISFIDSDDTINTDMFMSLILSIEANSCDICMCGSYTVDTHENILATDVFPNNKVYMSDELMTSIILPLKTASWNKLYRKNFIGDCKFPNGRVHGEDLVFILSLLKADTRLCTTNYIGYNYFKRGGSITTCTFVPRAFDEVWCKDKALEIVQQKFPKYIWNFKVFSFRARLNLMRKMIKSEKTNLSQYNEYRDWLIREYKSLPLPKKDKIEYLFLMYIAIIYKLIFVR